jgi:hypothetical protein
MRLAYLSRGTPAVRDLATDYIFIPLFILKLGSVE